MKAFLHRSIDNIDNYSERILGVSVLALSLSEIYKSWIIPVPIIKGYNLHIGWILYVLFIILSILFTIWAISRSKDITKLEAKVSLLENEVGKKSSAVCNLESRVLEAVGDSNELIIVNDNQKFEAIKYRHEDQSRLLQKMTDVDLKIFISFLTMQLVFGSYISQVGLNSGSRIGLLFLDISLSLVVSFFLWNNFKRRKEVVSVIKNCNQALGYDSPGFFIKKESINNPTTFRSWFFVGMIIGVIISISGIIIIILSTPNST